MSTSPQCEPGTPTRRVRPPESQPPESRSPESRSPGIVDAEQARSPGARCQPGAPPRPVPKKVPEKRRNQEGGQTGSSRPIGRAPRGSERRRRRQGNRPAVQKDHDRRNESRGTARNTVPILRISKTGLPAPDPARKNIGVRPGERLRFRSHESARPAPETGRQNVVRFSRDPSRASPRAGSGRTTPDPTSSWPAGGLYVASPWAAPG